MRRFVLFVLTITALGFPVLTRADTWDIDPTHTSAHFAVRHLMVSTVRGEFGKVSGTVNLEEQDPIRSSVEATIDVASLNTRVVKRDDHLKGPDFFDAAKYPTITFKSKKIEKVGDNKFTVIGDLTLRGVTKEVVLDVEGSPEAIKDPLGNMRIGGQASTKINRKDFGIVYNAPLQTGGVLIGEEVTIIIDVELTKKPEQASAPGSSATGAQ